MFQCENFYTKTILLNILLHTTFIRDLLTTNNPCWTRTYIQLTYHSYCPVQYSSVANLSIIIRRSFSFSEFYVKHDKSNLDLFDLFGILIIYTYFNFLFIPFPFLLYISDLRTYLEKCQLLASSSNLYLIIQIYII